MSNQNYLSIIVMGKGYIDKSSLIHSYIKYESKNDQYPIQDRYNITKTMDNKPYNIVIIDTPGEGDYQNMDNIITYGEGFLLVFSIDDKDSFDILKDKRQRILTVKRKDFVPMFLVGIKQDLNNKRQISYEKAKNIADSWNAEYIETSIQNNANIIEAFEILISQIISIKEKKNSSCFIF